MACARHSRQSGFTLIELILSMVLISIAVTGVLSVMNLTVKYSADPLIQHQALAVAEAYLEEILLQSYADPTTPTAPIGPDAGETRRTFDDADDYNGLNNTGVRDQQDNLINTLATYNVTVAVADQVVSGLAARRVIVTVTAPGLPTPLSLSGYKFDN